MSSGSDHIRSEGCARGDHVRHGDAVERARGRTAKGTLVGDLLAALNGADLIEGADVGRKAAVDAQHAAIDESGQREVVKHLAAVPPRVKVAVLLKALICQKHTSKKEKWAADEMRTVR